MVKAEQCIRITLCRISFNFHRNRVRIICNLFLIDSVNIVVILSLWQSHFETNACIIWNKLTVKGLLVYNSTRLFISRSLVRSNIKYELASCNNLKKVINCLSNKIRCLCIFKVRSTTYYKLYSNRLRNSCSCRWILLEDCTCIRSIRLVLWLGKHDKRLCLSGKKCLKLHAKVFNIHASIFINLVYNNTTAYYKRNTAVALYDCTRIRRLIKNCTFITRNVRIAQADFWIKLLYLHFE